MPPALADHMLVVADPLPTSRGTTYSSSYQPAPSASTSCATPASIAGASARLSSPRRWPSARYAACFRYGSRAHPHDHDPPQDPNGEYKETWGTYREVLGEQKALPGDLRYVDGMLSVLQVLMMKT